MTIKSIISTEEVEQLVDRASASELMASLLLVLEEKADHLEYNWQDKKSAAIYRRIARRVETLRNVMDEANI